LFALTTLTKGLPIVFIRLAFILQTTHQSAANAGDFRGIQGKILLFSHLDRNWCKLTQKCSATKGPSATTETANDFGFIPHSNLPQFNSGPKNGSQILHELAKIDAPFRREGKD
jgi:hypothetical protein